MSCRAGGLPGFYEAVEILTSGWCPLNCTYCYIPKSDVMRSLHKRIVDYVRSGRFIEDLKLVPGKKRIIGLWGTEPLLTLNEIRELLGELKKNFPELQEISFSTSLILDPQIIVDLAEEAGKYNICVDVQISLDGPSFITDKNRGRGVTDRVASNVIKLVESLNKLDTKSQVKIHWKPTISAENIREMIEEEERIHIYFKFFKELNGEITKRIKKKNILFDGGCAPTLVVPGKYTSKDGKNFYVFCKLLSENNYPNAYVPRLQRIFALMPEFHKQRMFTCSGGDSNIGFDGNVHICHRTFYMNREEYINSIIGMDKYKNWDVSLLEEGKIDQIKEWYIVNPKEGFNLLRFMHVLRGYHDFARLKLVSTYVMIKELSASGQISDVYLKEDTLAKLFAYFLVYAHSCPMENLLNTGSVHLTPISLIRMFGNGAFEVILSEVLRSGKHGVPKRE